MKRGATATPLFIQLLVEVSSLQNPVDSVEDFSHAAFESRIVTNQPR